MVFATIGFALESRPGARLGLVPLDHGRLFQLRHQTAGRADAVQGYRVCSGIVVGIFLPSARCCWSLIRLNKHLTIQMADELAERRRNLRPRPHSQKPHEKIISSRYPVVVIGAAYGDQPVFTARMTLKDAFKNDFLIGVAINQTQFDGEDQRGDPIIKAQFNAISRKTS